MLPVFFFDPRHFKTTRWGTAKTGVLRARFLIESVADLRTSLRQLGSDLLVGIGKPEDLIPKLTQSGTNFVLTSEQVTSEELAVDSALRAALRASSTRFETVWSSTMYEKRDLPFRDDLRDLPDGFTPFRNKVESKSKTQQPLPPPRAGSMKLPPTDSLMVEMGSAGMGFHTMPDIASLGFSAADVARKADSRGVMPFVGGETTALQRLKHYLWDGDHLATYFETRNGMLGADYSSKFSPWLAHGCLSARLVKQQCEEYEKRRVKNKSTYWLVFELLWRDFFRFYALKQGNAIFLSAGPAGQRQVWNNDPKAFEAWKAGRTGVPLVDANMRELAATGFMSNRGRQNVASYLVLDLRLDWRLGAAHFEDTLLDHDVTSNYGNWVAAAGLTGGRVNKFNLVKQSKDYDVNGEYVRHWCPELAKVPAPKVHEPWTLSQDEQRRYGCVLAQDYPARPLQVRGGGSGGGGTPRDGGRPSSGGNGGTPRDGGRPTAGSSGGGRPPSHGEMVRRAERGGRALGSAPSRVQTRY